MLVRDIRTGKLVSVTSYELMCGSLRLMQGADVRRMYARIKAECKAGLATMQCQKIR